MLFKSGKRRKASRLHLEALEARTVPTTYTLPLVNNTGLNPGQFSVYALGYSVASNLYLNSSGQFVDDSALTSIPAFNIASTPTLTLDTGKAITGARVYFFVAPPNTPISFTRLGDGGIIQPTNPPNSNYPPFDIVEITMDAGGAAPLHIDVQTVDGFIFPLTLTLNNSLGQVGTTLPANGAQPVITRAQVFPAYSAFMTAQGSAGDAYLPLVFGKDSVAGQYGGIVNPGGYLANGANPSSPLNTVWNSTLTTLFTDPNVKLSIQGVAASVPADIYTGGPFVLSLNNTNYNVLKLTGTTNHQVYYVFDPMTPNPTNPNPSFSAGGMVFANNGVFADPSANAVNGGDSTIALNLQNQIVSALNRGIATAAGAIGSGSPGYTSAYWGTQTNWYPANTTQNLFSKFMHTGKIAGTPIFTQPPGAINGMGQAYGFAYDENAGPVPPAPVGQPPVPSKFDPVPGGANTITITVGPWTSAALGGVPNPNVDYVTQLYLTTLDRQPDGTATTGGLGHWVSMLDAGGSDFQVAQGIWQSAEHRQLQVQQMFVQFLHRAADPGGVTFWSNQFAAGADETEVELGFVSSPEFTQVWGADTDAFISGVFQSLDLEPPAGTALATWEKIANNVSQHAAAVGILTFSDNYLNLIGDYYAEYLIRTPAKAELDYWLSYLELKDASPGTVAELFLSSPEFVQNSEQ